MKLIEWEKDKIIIDARYVLMLWGEEHNKVNYDTLEGSSSGGLNKWFATEVEAREFFERIKKQLEEA